MKLRDRMTEKDMATENIITGRPFKIIGRLYTDSVLYTAHLREQLMRAHYAL